MARIGVLAVQGAFEAHAAVLRRLGHEVVLVRSAIELHELGGLVLPGGESSVQLEMIERLGLLAPLRAFLASGAPVLATCAGVILLAREVEGPQQPSLGAIDIAVGRNGWGRQVESFEAESDADEHGRVRPLVFIRAPRVLSVGPAVEVLSTYRGEAVLVRQGTITCATFHPELTGDTSLHEETFRRAEGSASAGTTPRYEAIGGGYAVTRHEDPLLRERIHAALGDARTIVNVGAGTGSYEPADRHVIAIEPSDTMAAQRPAHLAPAIRASAGSLPLRDRSVDAAMAILTLHHWDDEQERGVRELRRVTRGPVVIVTYDPLLSGKMWLMEDYFPEVAALDATIFPPIEVVSGWLGGEVIVSPLPIARDTPDWHLGSFWAHPERVLDARARSATSGFARAAPEVVARVVDAVAKDLASGAWDEKHGRLRGLQALDVGMRLLVATG